MASTFGSYGRSRLPCAPPLDARQVRHRVVALGERGDAVDEAGPRDAELHRLRIVAVDAGDRVGFAEVMIVGLGLAVSAPPYLGVTSDLLRRLRQRLAGVSGVKPPGNRGSLVPGVPSGVWSSSCVRGGVVHRAGKLEALHDGRPVEVGSQRCGVRRCSPTPRARAGDTSE